MQRAKYLFGTISWSSIAHLLLNLTVVIAVVTFVRLELAIMAVGVILASKWRIIAVQPRHWLANFRTNSVDLIFNLSMVIMLMRSTSFSANVLWASIYAFWLIWLKPQSREIYVGAQSLVSLFFGLMALGWLTESLNEVAIVFLAWLIGLSTARHFVSQFEEPLVRVISFGWGFFVAQMVWLMNRWLVVYPISSDVVVPQMSVVLTVIAYMLGTLYYLQQNEALKRQITRTYILSTSAIIVVIVWLTDWTLNR